MTSAPVDYKVQLEVFEGPLDLLLHLVKKHELNIFDISVAFITEKYLEYLELMRQLNLEIAGEYLLMAATLAHIKSRELLPSPDPSQADAPDGEGDEESEIDTRQELIRRLLEYQKYRDAANALGDRPVVGRNVWTRGAPVEDLLPEGADLSSEPPLMDVPVFDLLAALNDVLGRARVKLSHEVTVERLSITDRINQLVDRLERQGSFAFRDCFDFVDSGTLGPGELRHQVIVTFLAILEMAKLKLVRIVQAHGEPDAAGEAAAQGGEGGQRSPSDIFISAAGEDLRARAAQSFGGGDGDGEYR